MNQWFDVVHQTVWNDDIFIKQEGKMEAQILLWIQNNLRNPVLDAIMKFITSLGDGGYLWMAVILVLLIIPKTRKTGLLCLISFLLTFVVNNLALKNIVNRTRPYVAIPELVPITRLPHDASFPSGHTAISFSVAMVMILTMKKPYGIPAFVLASLIAISRPYVGVHYPSDVLCGFIVSSLIAFGTVECSKLIDKKLIGKKNKKLTVENEDKKLSEENLKTEKESEK